MSQNKISIDNLFEYVENGQDMTIDLKVENMISQLPDSEQLEQVVLDCISKKYIMHYSIDEDLNDLQDCIRNHFHDNNIILNVKRRVILKGHILLNNLINNENRDLIKGLICQKSLNNFMVINSTEDKLSILSHVKANQDSGKFTPIKIIINFEDLDKYFKDQKDLESFFDKIGGLGTQVIILGLNNDLNAALKNNISSIFEFNKVDFSKIKKEKISTLLQLNLKIQSDEPTYLL